MPCAHAFCQSCLSKLRNEGYDCPLCRSAISEGGSWRIETWGEQDVKDVVAVVEGGVRVILENDNDISETLITEMRVFDYGI